MDTVNTPDELREQLSDWRDAGDHIALIPTRGNLHDGQLSLVDIAREHAERVVVSIFVNPTEFESQEDYDEYPRTLERDKRRLKRVKADLIFHPEVETIYPFGLEHATRVSVAPIADGIRGAIKPGQFDNFTSVTARMFSLVQPDAAIFGQKDYQAQLMINRMTQDLCMPIKIICGETQREDDGLALSDENRHLSESDRRLAPNLHRVLASVGDGLGAGKRNFEELEKDAFDELKSLGFKPDYVAIRRAENLELPVRDCDELVVLGSAWLDKSRLTDNVVVHI